MAWPSASMPIVASAVRWCQRRASLNRTLVGEEWQVDLRRDHFYADTQPPNRIDQGPSSYVTSASLPNVLWDRGDELKTTHELACDRAAIRRVRVGAPSCSWRTILPFPELAIKRGRRQEPRMHNRITALVSGSKYGPRFPVAVLLRAAIWKANSKTLP